MAGSKESMIDPETDALRLARKAVYRRHLSSKRREERKAAGTCIECGLQACSTLRCKPCNVIKRRRQRQKEMTETELLWAFIAAVPATLPDVRVFRRNVINVQSAQGFRAVNGIKGQADAYALVRGGRHVEIETKAARGTMRDAQEAWQKYCISFSIPHLVLRAKPKEDPQATVDRWIVELSACLLTP